jgi:hypothetical protein
VLWSDTCIDDELPRRKVVAVTDVTSRIEQEVGYLGRSPQRLDIGRTCSLLQGTPEKEQLQRQETSFRRDMLGEA